MKNLICTSCFILATLFILAGVSSCKKSSTVTPTPAPYVKGEGQFSVAGVNFTADSAFSVANSNAIRIYQNFSSPTDNKLISIVLTGLSVGNYNISATGPNTLMYTFGTTAQATAQSGIVSITSNTGSRIAGTFNVQLNGPQTIQGSFSDVGIR